MYVDSNDIFYVTECSSNRVCMFSTSACMDSFYDMMAIVIDDGSSFEQPWFITFD